MAKRMLIRKDKKGATVKTETPKKRSIVRITKPKTRKLIRKKK